MNKIIKAIIEFDDTQDKYMIFAAINIPNKKWKAFHKIVTEISIDTIKDVINTGAILGTYQAKTLFPKIDKELTYTI